MNDKLDNKNKQIINEIYQLALLDIKLLKDLEIFIDSLKK